MPRVVELVAYHVRIPLRKVVRHASHTRDDTDTLIVACHLDNGTIGWGEGVPRSYVTGDTIHTALAHLHATDWTAQWGGLLSDLGAAVIRCRQFHLGDIPCPASTGEAHSPATAQPVAPATNSNGFPTPASNVEPVTQDDYWTHLSQRGCFGHAARCAVELSVLDAFARSEGVPLSRVTELVPETAPLRQQQQQVRYSAAVTPQVSWREWIRLFKVWYFNFHQSKVKVGVPGYDELRTLTRLRQLVGPQHDIRIDANEAWSCDNLLEKLAPLACYQITSVEQPVPVAQTDRLAQLRPALTIPVMLDESLCSLSDAERNIAAGNCDLFNIRLSKCGGLINSLLLAAMAARAGLGYQLGCQVGETGILSAAGRHFACSMGHIRYLEGSFDRYLVKERLTVEDISFRRAGFAPALTGPGLGVTIDPAAIQRTLQHEVHFRVS